MRVTALVLLLAPISTAAPAAILCVEPEGAAGCHETITSALAAADDGDTIRIAAGTYAENLLITENVTLEGGWDPSFSERDVSRFITRVVPTAGSTSSVVSIQGLSANPSQSTPNLDGLTVGEGRADLGGNQGGGLRIVDSYARIRNTTVLGNAAFFFGGGIWVKRGSPHFENCRIRDNVVTGGPLSWGAGIAVQDASATFVRCSVERNRITAMNGTGGGIAISNFASEQDQFLRIED